MARRRLRREEYRVGWVCALDIELAAAQEMLDEEHEDCEQDEHDNNLYSLGRIGDHNVVIVCLPAGLIGNNPAVTVATQMRSTFRSIRFGLMVGIGGGVPNAETDIRLGDVVVSQPRQGYGGIIQYDFGKATPSGFQRTGFLNSTPPVLLSAVTKVRANHLRQITKLSEYISKLYRLPEFTREAAGPDVLFKATYNHKGGSSCQSCALDKRVDRPSRENKGTVVHYGTIASGNQVMRDAAERDRVSAELGGILCFEMEAAGLMSSFPCLVIRGICDYSDSHKNKRWQAYAAGAAAAYAKEVLSVIPRAEMANTSLTAHDILNGSVGGITIVNAKGASAGNQLPTTAASASKAILKQYTQTDKVIVGNGKFSRPFAAVRIMAKLNNLILLRTVQASDKHSASKHVHVSLTMAADDSRSASVPLERERSNPLKRIASESDTNRLAQIPELNLRSSPSATIEFSSNHSQNPYSKHIKVRFSGLYSRLSARNYPNKPFSCTLDVPSDLLVENLGAFLLERQPNLKYSKDFLYPETLDPISPIWTDVYTTPVEVTSGRPFYASSRGPLKINRNQSIASFFSKVFPHPIEANLSSRKSGKSPFIPGSKEKVAISQCGNPDIAISFMRTVRIPEDGREYDLPPGLGRFPIFGVQQFADRLPVSMAAQGGLFIPMYEMEAMWIDFKLLSRKRRFAVRPFVGGVNGISGEPIVGNMKSLLRLMNSIIPRQDYIVLPEQRWLDGVATSPGIVKQFVATRFAPPRRQKTPWTTTSVDAADSNPKSKSGGTIEWQLTGEDSNGGFQLQIIPDFRTETMSATSTPNVRGSLSGLKLISYQGVGRALRYPVLQTPEELGLPNGSIIHVKDLSEISPHRPKTVLDLCIESPMILTKTQDVHVRVSENKAREHWNFTVCTKDEQKGAVSFSFDSDDEFHRILDVVRATFADNESSLHIANIVQNEPLTPVNSWADLNAICQFIHSWGHYRLPDGTFKCEFILTRSAESGSRSFCEVKETNHPSLLFENCRLSHFALKPRAKASDLRSLLEKITQKSLGDNLILSNGRVLCGDAQLFDNANVFTDFEGHWTSCRRFAVAENKKINIKVTDNSNEVFYAVNTTTRMAKVMSAFAERQGRTMSSIRFLYDGNRVNSWMLIGEYVGEGDTLEVYQEQIGGCGAEVSVKYMSSFRSVPVIGINTIGDLKDTLVEWSGITSDRQILSYDGKILDDEEPLWEFRNGHLDLEAKKVRPHLLGIGAGGVIKQHIEEDLNDPRIWDTANSKLINIQILDSTTFKHVTGLVPPDTPITAEVYQNTGLPFYKEWQENWKVASIAGEWKSLIGVAETAKLSDKSTEAGKQQQQPKCGLLKSGVWGELEEAMDGDMPELPGPDSPNGGKAGAFREQSFDFPVVLLDVDATVPEFRGAAEDDTHDDAHH